MKFLNFGSLNMDYVYQVEHFVQPGETYTGFFISGLMEGRTLQNCMRRASMASSIAVTKPGAAASIPTKEEVEKELGERT